MTREQLRMHIANRCGEVADLLGGPERYKVTIVARCVDPEFASPKNADIMVGDDDVDLTIAALERLKREGL